ncbi:hypothetical protein KAJ27_15600, partial [bacterium]|nr:hypothetical protein [bacterium]
SLYYSPTGSMIDAKLIKSGISENDENDFFVFDVRTVLDDEKVKAAGGVVYFIGKIYDGEGSAKFAVSPGWLKVKMDVSSDLDSLSIAHTPLYGLQEIADYPLDAYVKGPKVIPDDGYVKLFYKVNDDASYSQIEMTSSDYFKYSGTLPQAAADSVVYYYIEANDGSETVTSPASNAISAPYSFKVKGLDVTGWTGKLNLSVSESVDPDYFEWGMDKNATDYKDDLRDVIEDELTETGISVYSTITSADEKETFKLGTDIWEEKDLGASVMKNNLTIKAKNLSGKEITLNWDIMGVPANYGVQLIEKDTETYIDLREQTEHTIKITSADFSVEYIITTGLAYFEKTYRKGWNLISFPVNAVDEDLVPEKIKIVMDRFLYGKKFSIYHYNDGEFLGYDAKFGGRLGYFKIGKGYWIKLPADTKLSVKGLDVRYEENEEKGIFSLDLKGGDWNMIGSPKLQSVPFSKIAVSYQGQSLNIEDAIDQELIKPYFFWYELYGFNLGFIAADDAELMPGYGYFLKSEVDCKLIIAVDSTYSPPPKKSEKSDYRRQKKAIFADVKKWQVKISAYCGDYKDKDNFIGINENATDGSDIRDVLEPMAITPGLSLYFPHPEYKSSEKGNYTVDIREPVASDGNIIWDMELVKYDLKTSDAELKWELSDFPSDYKLILKNMKTGAEYNMTSIKNAKIPLQNNEAVKFKVIYYKRTKPSY